MTYLVPQHLQQITVVTDESGALMRFSWRGTSQRIIQITNSWRVDDGWWVFRMWREYVLVTTDRAWLVLLYHDLLSDECERFENSAVARRLVRL